MNENTIWARRRRIFFRNQNIEYRIYEWKRQFEAQMLRFGIAVFIHKSDIRYSGF